MYIIDLQSQAWRWKKVAKAPSTSDKYKLRQNASSVRGVAYKKVLLDVVLASPVHDGEEDANDVQPAVTRPLRLGPAEHHQKQRYCAAIYDQYRVSQGDGMLDLISESQDMSAAICCASTCW